jgi:hypothetical protein
LGKNKVAEIAEIAKRATENAFKAMPVHDLMKA